MVSLRLILATVDLRYDPALIAGFLLVLNLAGTFVFALSGAMAGAQHRGPVGGPGPRASPQRRRD
jgi:hypothetical protein